MNEFTGKKLLVLGGASVHCKIVKAAKEMGVYTIVTDYLTDSPAKKLADKSYMYDVNDIDGIVEMCKQEKVDGVIGPYLDPCQRPYYEICHLLSLPCYIDTWEQVFTLTDKDAFKACCMKNGVDIIPTYDLNEPAKIEYPVLVKPAHSRGSRGQMVCSTFEETEKAVSEAQKESDNGRALIEKYMGTKNNFTMNILFADGDAYITKTSDIYTGSLESHLENVLNGVISPSYYMDLYLEKVHTRVINMLKALGIKNGPVFMQGFVDGDTIRFYDPGFRFPGSEYDLMLHALTGVNIMKILIGFAFTGKMKNEFFLLNADTVKLNHRVTATLTPILRPGKITNIGGLEEIGAMPDVIDCAIRHEVGDVITFSKNVNQRIGAFSLLGNSISDIKKSICKVLSTLRVMDENREDMLFGNDIVENMVTTDVK